MTSSFNSKIFEEASSSTDIRNEYTFNHFLELHACTPQEDTPDNTCFVCCLSPQLGESFSEPRNIHAQPSSSFTKELNLYNAEFVIQEKSFRIRHDLIAPSHKMLVHSIEFPKIQYMLENDSTQQESPTELSPGILSPPEVFTNENLLNLNLDDKKTDSNNTDNKIQATQLQSRITELPTRCNSIETMHPTTDSDNYLRTQSSNQEASPFSMESDQCNLLLDTNNILSRQSCEEFVPVELQMFKMVPCSNLSATHDRKNCVFYHSLRDKRRCPKLYQAEQCPYQFDVDHQARCPYGDSCQKCHNRQELLYHPDIYKQKFCSTFPNAKCHRGILCAFAHNRQEIRCPLFSFENETFVKGENSTEIDANWMSTTFFMMQFKTIWCPYGVQHDWHKCFYAHTYQDCRRSPFIGYHSEPCQFWGKDVQCLTYQSRCPNGVRCAFSHGSKEQLYHPNYYKTMPCVYYSSTGTCPRRRLCAFYHTDEEWREIPKPTKKKSSESPILPEQHMRALQPRFLHPPALIIDSLSLAHNERQTAFEPYMNSYNDYYTFH